MLTSIPFLETLDNNSNTTLQLAKSCSEAQLLFKKNDNWSILQILEHICKTDKVVIDLIEKPSDKISETEEILGTKKLTKLVVEARAFKVKAPEILLPIGTISNVNDFEKLFLSQRNLLKKKIESGKIIIDNRIHKHPYLGEMTIIDWLNFIVNHTQRHLEQIKDLFREIEK
ncbi:MAG TPA: DinB family protein [Bacteroidia bacterium]|nr:DinB family protein [Bacteroidia bacterium]